MALLDYSKRFADKGSQQWHDTYHDLFTQFVDSDPYDASDNTADSCSSGDLGSILESPEYLSDEFRVSDPAVHTSSTALVTSKSVIELGQSAADRNRSALIGESFISSKPGWPTVWPKMAQPTLTPRASHERWTSKLEERAERLSLRDRYQQDPPSASQSANLNQWDDQSTFPSTSTTSPCQDINKRQRGLITYDNNTNLRHSQSVPQYSTSTSFSPLSSPMNEGSYGGDPRSPYHHLHTPATTTDTPFLQDYFFQDQTYTQFQQQQDPDTAWEHDPQSSAMFGYSQYDMVATGDFQDPKVQPWWPPQASPSQPWSPANPLTGQHHAAHGGQQVHPQLSHRRSNDNLAAAYQPQQPMVPAHSFNPHQEPSQMGDTGLMIQFPPGRTDPSHGQQGMPTNAPIPRDVSGPTSHSFAPPRQSVPSHSQPLQRYHSANPSLPTLTTPTSSRTSNQTAAPAAGSFSSSGHGKSRQVANLEHLRQQRSRSDLRQKSHSSRSPSPDSAQAGKSSRRPSGKYGSHRRSKTTGSVGKSGGGSGSGGSSGAGVGFVNYTPDDSKKILTGVAPSGSSKTKARREKEAADKRRRLSQAAQKAVMEAGGDLTALEREGFLFDD